MGKNEMKSNFDLAAIEAEENFLIDIQFLLQKVLTDKGVTRSVLAKKRGISKARLSQIFAAEANPTVKSCARLFHALGEELTVSVKNSERKTPSMDENSDWRFDTEDTALDTRKRGTAGDDRLIAVLKEAIASNDNYRNQVEIWDGGEPIEMQAA
jgi:DNA-binding phage protein